MTTNYIAANGCATAARTEDGSLGIAYMPTLRPLTVDMAQLAGPAIARWYDPTDGAFTEVGGAPIANVANVTFRPPNRNRAGDGDWVLVLETAGTRG
jgi:Putative collagen-binding domain of a collagenase